MTKNKTIGCIILLFFLILSVFLLFTIPSKATTAVWITAFFDMLTFLSQLVFWMGMFRKTGPKEAVVYKTPAMTVSFIYIIVQFLICIVVALTASSISNKVALIANFLLLILIWILIVALISAKDYAKKIDSRQKDHHIEL